jgi:hypothetical protein
MPQIFLPDQEIDSPLIAPSHARSFLGIDVQ